VTHPWTWVADRSPPPPAELAGRMEEALRGQEGGDPSALVASLARAARAEVDGAVALPERSRARAFRLLLGDALITYACEAAVDAQDPEGALRTVLDLGARS